VFKQEAVNPEVTELGTMQSHVVAVQAFERAAPWPLPFLHSSLNLNERLPMNPTPEQASPTSNLFRQRSEKPNSTNDGSEYGDGDTASQRSISLSSAGPSPRHSMAQTADKRVSKPYTLDTDMSSEVDDVSFGGGRYQLDDSFSPSTSAPASVYDEEAENKVNEIYSASTTYPPDRKSMASLSSQSSRKARPESLLVTLPEGQLVLGVALVDFNHVVRCSVLLFFQANDTNRLVLPLNGQKVVYSRTKRWSRSYRFSHCQMVHIWYAA